VRKTTDAATLPVLRKAGWPDLKQALSRSSVRDLGRAESNVDGMTEPMSAFNQPCSF